MDFGDSGELYTIRNQFYTWQHEKVLAHDFQQFNDENQIKVVEYQIRSCIYIKKDASSLIDRARNHFTDKEELFQCLSSWNDLQTFGTDDSTYFEDIKQPTFEIQVILMAFYLVKFVKSVDQAILVLETYINEKNILKANELESYLVLAQLYLIKGQFDKAYQIFRAFPSAGKDDIIYHLLESWIFAIKGENENINSSYYFYDELLLADFDGDELNQFKILNILFELTLKLRHLPEAGELAAQIKELNVKPDFKHDFLVNNVVFQYLLGSTPDIKDLNPDHQFVIDHQEKTEKFNEIVKKYAVN